MKQNFYTFAFTEIVSAYELLERWHSIDASWLAEIINISIVERNSRLYPCVYLCESSYYDDKGTQIFKLKRLNTPPQVFYPEPGECVVFARDGSSFCFDGYYFKADEIDCYERAHPNVLQAIQGQPSPDKDPAQGDEATPLQAQAAGQEAQAGEVRKIDRAPAIQIPRSLFAGKAPNSIRDNMRKQGHSDEVIAYVMVNEGGITKIMAGKSLSSGKDKEPRDESTFRKRINSLLKKCPPGSIAVTD